MPPKTERFELRLDEELLAEIDAWAGEQSDSPSRAEAARRLLEAGLRLKASDSVHFTDGEKALIVMMDELFTALKISAPNSNAKFLADVIYGGHYWAPRWDMQGVFHQHADDPRTVRHVVDVLDMWMFMEEAVDALTSEQRDQVSKKLALKGDLLKFPGFDGNNEADQLNAARFLIDKMNRFSRFKARDLNSHVETSDRYTVMLRQFGPMRRSGGLSFQGLMKLLTTYWGKQ